MSYSSHAKRGRTLLHTSFLCLLVAVFLLSSNGTASHTVLAATPPPTASAPSLGKTIITDDKAFAIDYPVGYVTQHAPNLVALGSSQAAMDEALKAKPTLSSGNVVIQIQYFPAGSDASSVFDVSSTEALLKSVIKSANMTFGDITSFKLGTIEGSRTVLQEKAFDGIVISFLVDKTPFLAVILTATGEADQYEATLDAVVQSIRSSTSTSAAKPTPVVVSGDAVALGKTYTTKDQQISIDYPEGWITEDNSGTPNFVNFGSSKDALDQIAHQSSPKLTSGQVALQLLYGLPGQKLPLGLDDSTPENLINGVIKNLPWKVGDIQPITLGQYDAVRVDITDANLSGVFIAVTGGKVPVLAGIFTAPDEASKVEPILEAIVLSVRVNGDSPSSSDTTPEATPADSSSSDGNTLNKTFISSDKSLSVQYPSGWATQSTEPYRVTLATSSKTIDALNSSATPTLESGEEGVQFNYLLASDVPAGMDVSGDPAKLLKSLTSGVPSPIKVGKIESAKLGTLDAARVTLDTDTMEAVVYAFFIDKTPVYVIAAAAPGELAQFQATLEAMILSVQINIPAKS